MVIWVRRGGWDSNIGTYNSDINSYCFLMNWEHIREKEVKMSGMPLLARAGNSLLQNKKLGLKFKVCKSVHHCSIQINQPTRCNNFSSLLLDVYIQLSMFWASSRPSSGAQQLQAGRPARPRPTALPPPRSNVKTRGCYCSWAPDDWREDARNMLSCTQTSSNKLEKLLHPVGWFIWIEEIRCNLMRGLRFPQRCW
jgi:hypothetical protein